jgi:hypothetical protein
VKCWIVSRGAAATAALLLLATLIGARAEPRSPTSASPTANFGPYNATFLAGGIGLTEPLTPDTPALEPGASWSISGWLRVDRQNAGVVIVAAVGELPPARCLCLMLDQGRLALAVDPNSPLRAGRPIEPAAWHAIAATYDGRVARLYTDGVEVASQETASREVTSRKVALGETALRETALRETPLERVSAVLRLAPETLADLSGEHHFGGSVALFQLHARALNAAEVSQLAAARPNFSLIDFHRVGVGWPWQERAWRGLLEPQPAWTLPRGNTGPSAPVRDVRAAATPPLQPNGSDRWTLGAWHMFTDGPPSPSASPPPSGSGSGSTSTSTSVAEPLTTGFSGKMVSAPEFDATYWYPAIVPGTVLTTLIANGAYPDPDYGLNNLAIPESLNRQDYWYRTRFTPAPPLRGRQLTLTFNGINYAADVWLNGIHLGSIQGAFVRGAFDVTAIVRIGEENVLAVRVSPPPHPGIPHEQSVAAGPGGNGGNLAIDGPTFIATEGWDWLPAQRDRDTGIWQDVELTASGPVHILDPQIVTRLPLPQTQPADILLQVPLENRSTAATSATLTADFEGIRVQKSVTLPPGVSEIALTPAEFPQLRLARPRLWWPNGYGKPELYTATIGVSVGPELSDSIALESASSPTSCRCSITTAPCAGSKSILPRGAPGTNASSTYVTPR